MTKQIVRPYSSLRAWRQAKGFTQEEAAAFLGIGQAYYSKLERHEQAPRKVILQRLMERTGVPVDELMGIAS